MSIQLVRLPQTLFNLQRLYLAQHERRDWVGKCVKLRLPTGAELLCRLFLDPILPSNCALYEASVESDVTHSDLCDFQLELLPPTKHIKTMKIVVVLSNIRERNNWCRRRLSHLKRLLHLFILASDTVVNLSGFETAQKLGVTRVIVKSIGKVKLGKVVDGTDIIVEKLVSLERFDQMKTKVEDRIPGTEVAFQELCDYVTCRSTSITLRYKMPQVLFVGPPGSGKKTLIRQVARTTDSLLFTLNCADLSHPQPGETESILRQKFAEAVSHVDEGPVLLHLLNLETVARKQGRILSQINSLLDTVTVTRNLTVVATSSSPQELHASIKTSCRLQHAVFLGVPNEMERSLIFRALTSDWELTLEMCSDLAKVTPGFVLADMALVLNRSKRAFAQNTSANAQERYESLMRCASVTTPSSIHGELGVIRPTSSIPELGGLAEEKRKLAQIVQWPLLHSAAFERLNISQPSGILLYGPPGCAKTSLARTVASANNITFLAVSAADIYSPYVGDSEQTISHLFQRARAAAPSLLFIDEIDALVGCRDGRQKGVQDKVLSSFLIEMDGIGHSTEMKSSSHVIVMAATNRPHVLDSALLRPGRFDRLMYIPPPNEADRLDILRILTTRMPLHDSVDLREIAAKTPLFSGADLSNLIREAAMQAMTEKGVDTTSVSRDHLDRALKEIPPSLTSHQIQWYKDFSFQ